jgi:tetratricopeptide (TPR) repeat protein
MSLLDGSYPLLMEVGRRLQISGKTEPARHIFERAWSDFPDLGPAPQALAVIYHREGDFKAAIEAAGAASIAYGGSNAVSNHLWAHSLAAEGRWEESVTARLMTIESGEGHQWQQWLWLGQAYANSGDTIRGLTALDSARVRTEYPESIRQIDSIRVTLMGSENATGSQNP